MGITERSATCPACGWTATGPTAWTQADGHEADVGHDVHRSGPGAAGTRPAPFTQPLDTPEQ